MTHLAFDQHFNQPVNSLPNTITQISFGGGFENSIFNLPHSTTHIGFESCREHVLHDSHRNFRTHPPSVTHMKLDWFYNNHDQEFNTVVPKGLQRLSLSVIVDKDEVVHDIGEIIMDVDFVSRTLSVSHAHGASRFISPLPFF